MSLVRIVFLLLVINIPICAQNNSSEQILAQVGSHPIYTSEFKSRYTDYLLATGVKDNFVVRSSILNNMVSELLLKYYDNNEEVEANPEYKKELGWVEKQIILAFLKDQEIYAKINVTDEELRESFERSNEKLAARHLYTETEEEANNIYELLNIGVDFNTLANQLFTDSTLRNNGGYLGYFSYGDMDPEFEEAAYSLKIGEISKPVKTEHGYSIIKLEDRVSNPLLTENEYQKKKSQLERTLKISKKKPYEKEYISKIFDLEKVNYNDNNLQDVLFMLSKDPSSEDIKFSPSSICATYENESYNASYLISRISEIPSYHRQKIITLDNLKSATAGIILQDKLLGIAKKKKYDKAPEVVKRIKKINDAVLIRFKQDIITENAEISDSIANEYYNRNIHFFSTPPQINIQEIIIDNGILADSLLGLINNGEDFGSLAKQYSLREWSAKNNGIVGYVEQEKFGMLADTLWSSQVGAVLGPFKVQEIYGIFKLLGKIQSKPIDFHMVKKEVYKAVKFEQKGEILRDYIGGLHKKAEIEVNEVLLRNLNIIDEL